MSDIFQRGREVAIEQLAPKGSNPKAKGQVATLTLKAGGTYAPGGAVTPAAPVVQSISGLEGGIKINRDAFQEILAGDSFMAISPVQTNGQDLAYLDQLPNSATVTFADGTVKMVKGVDPKRPSGLLISAVLQLRGTASA